MTILIQTAVLSVFLGQGIQAWVSQYQPSLRCATRRHVATMSSTSNVVLRPSEESTKKFDTFKIGNPRVHRYSRDQDPDSVTEYVMWYHGRSHEMAHDKDNSLPPLSTGRIGRATSKNGLIWVKDEDGSVSEDAIDVSLGLNNESWWGFDTAHAGLGNVLLPMSTPAVLTEGGVYIMYYMGGNYEETPLGDYMEKELPDSMKDATIQGMKMRIGVAISQDGITWGRVEGDDPSGACMVPFERKDPDAGKNGVPEDMPEELYNAWPEVVVDIDASGEDDAFRMYYSTMTKVEKQKSIAFGVSPDGFRWFKRGLCITPDEGTFDAAGCARCCVVRNAIYNTDKGTWEEASGWKMYYEGVSAEDNKHRIMGAESSDGQTWTKTGLLLDVGGEDAWDFGGVGSPHIVRLDNGEQRMYYTGQDADGSTAIGVAKLSVVSREWEREQATFVLPP